MSEKDRARMNTDKKRGTILTLVNNISITDLNHKCKHMDAAHHASSTLSRNCLNDFKHCTVFFFPNNVRVNFLDKPEDNIHAHQ